MRRSESRPGARHCTLDYIRIPRQRDFLDFPLTEPLRSSVVKRPKFWFSYDTAGLTGGLMTLNRRLTGVAALILLLGALTSARAAVTVDLSAPPYPAPTHVNGFEGIPNDGTLYTSSNGTPYSEGGITVQQVNGDPSFGIWATFFHPEGDFGWYPNGGDDGYTKITRTDGGNFGDVHFDVSTGFLTSTLLYQLYEGGNPVNALNGLSGVGPSLTTGTTSYMGFLGGGFDTILVRDTPDADPGTVDFVGGGLNALALDAIQNVGGTVIIPEPASLVIWGIGAIGLIGGFGRSRRKGPAHTT
jgi:hypothetical protein